jgi:pilus assembly protein Flp/PilA
MESIMKTLTSLHREESGQGLVEYVLILALVALGAIVGMSSVASSINSAFSTIAGKLGTYIS